VAKQKQVAKIKEEDCIGCTKCIDACPFDAIIGATKQIHTVIAEYCTGCQLCLPPCPVSCIELLPTEQEKNAEAAKARRQMRTARLNEIEEEKRAAAQLATPDNFQQAILDCLKRTEQKDKKTFSWEGSHE
jgi:electron transport complex protein RnfB